MTVQCLTPPGTRDRELGTTVTTHEWNSGHGSALARDVGFALVTGTGGYAGAKLHDVVDPPDIAFTESYPEDGLNLSVEPTTGTKRASFGYGVLTWGGESQVRTQSWVDHLDPNYSPSPLGMPSTHTGGASGGPWIYNYAPVSDGHHRNVINGVNSYVYTGTDRMYSPQFDDKITGSGRLRPRSPLPRRRQSAPFPNRHR
jgi:hypothetical protein